MCGIAGAFAKKFSTSMPAIVAAVTDAQTPRGPDHQALTEIKSDTFAVVLGHNRLSIIDLSTQANQPMWDANQRFCLTYNGEIYNYRELRLELEKLGHVFRSQSDTEVILQAWQRWGEACLSYFNGPFAFAMVDKKTGQLWLCRDRFGVKPLYYAIDQHVLYFASTVAALAKQLKLAPNLAYCQRGLRYWVYEDDSDIAPYENLKALLPGHYLKIDASLNIQIVRYYNLESRVAALRENLHQQNPKALIEQTFAHLQRAIGLRLRADVPVGVAISGGLDSSSIAALIADAALPVNGFTYGHPDNKKTEGPLVAQLAKKINLTMHYVDPNVSQFTQALFATLQAQQAPFPSASVIAQYLVYQRAHEMGLKVLLGGQGGDESFMGYRKYFSFSLQRLLQDKNYGSALYLMAQMLPLLLAEMPRWKSFWQHRLRYQNSSAQAYSNIRFPNTEPFSLTPTTDHIWQRQLQDVTRFSLPTLLRYEDRNSMANSIESRLPFMDYELVEFGIALPEALKLHKGYGKWVIREMMQNKIPNTIRKARYKRGFDVGLAHLMAQGLGENIRQALHERYAHIKKYLMPYTHIMDSFSDKQLQVRQQTFAEAMTLLWLGDITT